MSMRRTHRVTTSTRQRISALALSSAVLAAACGGGATTTPSQASPSTAASEQPSPSAGMAAPEFPSGNVSIGGAGATFPAPLYAVWFDAVNYNHNNIQIDYQAIGSGGGIKAITQQTVDFGATDAAMKD